VYRFKIQAEKDLFLIRHIANQFAQGSREYFDQAALSAAIAEIQLETFVGFGPASGKSATIPSLATDG
jgi:hypothetical protein